MNCEILNEYASNNQFWMNLPISENVRCVLFSEIQNILFVFSMSFSVCEFWYGPYVPKRVVDPLKLLINGHKIDRLLIIDISMCLVILNKICLLLLDIVLGNTICAFSKPFSVLTNSFCATLRSILCIPDGSCVRSQQIDRQFTIEWIGYVTSS